MAKLTLFHTYRNHCLLWLSIRCIQLWVAPPSGNPPWADGSLGGFLSGVFIRRRGDLEGLLGRLCIFRQDVNGPASLRREGGCRVSVWGVQRRSFFCWILAPATPNHKHCLVDSETFLAYRFTHRQDRKIAKWRLVRPKPALCPIAPYWNFEKRKLRIWLLSRRKIWDRWM